MRENRTSGTVWGVSGNRHSYHDGVLKRKVILYLLLDAMEGNNVLHLVL